MRQALTAFSPFNLDVLKTSCLARVYTKDANISAVKERSVIHQGFTAKPKQQF